MEATSKDVDVSERFKELKSKNMDAYKSARNYRLFKHRHKWSESMRNVFGIVVERKCKCGSYQHHLFSGQPKMFGGTPEWISGQHPTNKQGD